MPTLTHADYLRRLYELASDQQAYRDPMRKAWILIEAELRARYGVRRYYTYNSFKAGRSRKPVGIRLTVCELV